MWAYVASFVLPGHISFLAHLKERIEKGIAGVSTETFKNFGNFWKLELTLNIFFSVHIEIPERLRVLHFNNFSNRSKGSSIAFWLDNQRHGHPDNVKNRYNYRRIWHLSLFSKLSLNHSIDCERKLHGPLIGSAGIGFLIAGALKCIRLPGLQWATVHLRRTKWRTDSKQLSPWPDKAITIDLELLLYSSQSHFRLIYCCSQWYNIHEWVCLSLKVLHSQFSPRPISQSIHLKESKSN